MIPRTDDEKLQFAAIRTEAYAECQPQGGTETLLVDRLIHARCSLLRATRLLGEIETGTVDDATDPEKSKQIARLHRYIQMHERSQYRALQTLKGEQTNRALRQASLGLIGLAGIPPLANFSKVAKLFQQTRNSARPKTAEELFKNAADKADKIIAQEIKEHGPIPPALRSLIQDIIRQRAGQPEPQNEQTEQK